MTLPITVLFFPLLFFLPGYLTARALFRDGDALSPGEKLFIAIAVSILISTWFGLILAEFGWFSLPGLSLLVAAYCALVWLARRTPLLPPFVRGDMRGVNVDWIFVAILALGTLLAAHPAEYVLGNYDASTYVNVGAIIARTGAIAIHDPLVQELPTDPSRQFFWDLTNPFMLYKQVRLPGFFVADAATGLVLPQFLQLYPVWLAIFDGALGLRWGLYATPVIGLLGSIAAYFVARTLFGRNLARLAFFLLVINVPQFWFARYPVAEAMTQFLLLTGMFAFLRSRTLSLSSGHELTVLGRGLSVLGRELYSHPNDDTHPNAETGPNIGAVPRTEAPSPLPDSGIGFPLIAGVAFAEIFLARADAILLLAPLGLYALIVIFARRWRREHWAFFVAFGVIFAHAVAHIWVFAPDYVYFQYSHFLRMKNLDKFLPGGTGLPNAQDFLRNPASLLPLLAVGITSLAALFVLDRVVQVGRRRWGSQFFSWTNRYSSPLRWTGVGILVMLFILAYFVAPHPQTLYAYVGGETPLGRSANLIKLGWYLSPFGLVLALIGAAVVVRRDLKRHNAFFFSTGALFSAFYLEELYSNPHYIYTIRHYIPLVIPLFVLLAARGLQFLWGVGARHSRQLEEKPPSGSRPFGLLARVSYADASPLLARTLAGSALALWLAYNVYAMGLIDASRATGIALRLPFVGQTTRLGPLRLDPIGDSIVGVSELGGSMDQVEALANQIDPNAVIIFSNNRDEPALLATPLRFLFDRDALVSRFNQPNGEKIATLIDNWRAQGREVILAFGTNGGKLAVPGYSLALIGHFALDVPQWVFAYQYMPRSAWRVNLNYALYRALPSSAPATYPFTIDFGGDDYPALVGGFLERPTGATTRSMGALPDPSAPRPQAKSLTATLRVPAGGSPSAFLDLALTVRAPQAGMRLAIKSGQTSLGEVKLTQEFTTYHFSLSPANLRREGDTFLIELNTPAFADPDGRLLGAEFKEAVVSRQ